MLRDFLVCERKVHLDLRGDHAQRDLTSPFVKMLWRDGVAHEATFLAGLSEEKADLRALGPSEAERSTARAMADGVPVILGGRIAYSDLIGMPDILRRAPDGYVASDVKSGSALKPANASYKSDYLVQVAHYAYILKATGFGSGQTGGIVDRHGLETMYDLSLAVGRSYSSGFAFHLNALERTRGIRDDALPTRGALAAKCSLCEWGSVCRHELTSSDDLTRIAGLGRSLREPLELVARSVAELASITPPVGTRSTGIPGIGPDRLSRLIDRARLISNPDAGPIAREPLMMPRNDHCIDFDVEADPVRGLVYLHGFWHERAGEDDAFHHCFAPTPDEAGERQAFAEAIAHFREHRSAHWFHYSAYEKTAYRGLQRKYPEICDESEIDAIFHHERCTDLYNVIARKTDWPLSSYGIKSIAKSCGFKWEDVDPSGAASIEWYDNYVRSGDASIRDRIIAYNRDDVIASARVRAALEELERTGSIAGFKRLA